MARRSSRSGGLYFKSNPWQGRIAPVLMAERPPFGQGLSLTEKMYSRKFVKSESGSSICNLHYAAFAMQGFRKHMQDDYQCVPNYTIGLSKEPCASFAVYDGHGARGHAVSSYCAETFLGSVYGRKALRTARHITTELMTAGIHKTFLKFDQQLRDEQMMFGAAMTTMPGPSSSISQLPLQYSGTTVTSVFISDEDIVFANLGDSRTILCKNGQVEFETTDHNPVLEEESKRIKAAGGRVHTNPNKHTVIMDPDITGNCDFSISRALGDFAFKIPTEKPPEEYMVSPIPNVYVVKRDYQADQFLLLASDGIFKSLSSEEVMKFVLNALQYTSDITSICHNLILTAYYSYENIPDDTTVVLIVFPAAPEVSHTVLKEEETHRRQAFLEIEKELRVLVSNAEDVRILDNEFSIFLNLVKKLPPEYKLQLKMDFFRETLDELRVECYGRHSSKRPSRTVSTIDRTRPEVNSQECNKDSYNINGGSRATASDDVDAIDKIEPSTRVISVAHDQSEKQDSRCVQKEEISDSAVNVIKDVADEEVVSQ